MFFSQGVFAQTSGVILHWGGDDNGISGNMPRNPTQTIEIGQDDHTLYMSNVGFDCVLRIIDDDDNVVYSTYVAASTNTVVLPSNLSGSYRIELVTDDWLFWGYILL